MSRRVSIGKRVKEIWSRTVSEKIIGGLGRCVKINLKDLETDCPNCYYDAINRSSTNKYFPGGPKPFTYGRCPVCGGKGRILIPRVRYINCLVNWIDLSTSNEFEFLEPGRASASVVRIKTDPKYLNALNDCKSIEVDGFECILAKPLLVRGLGSKKVLIGYFKTEQK